MSWVISAIKQNAQIYFEKLVAMNFMFQCLNVYDGIFTSGEEVLFSPVSVCLLFGWLVGLFVSRITQQLRHLPLAEVCTLLSVILVTHVVNLKIPFVINIPQYQHLLQFSFCPSADVY